MTPEPSSALIRDLGLKEHPEGGYYVVTDYQEERAPSPFADSMIRSLASSIYYMLTFDRPSGTFHMNKSVTYHVLHQGRAEYTLIKPSNPPIIEKIIMGPNVAAGETRMLLVGTGVWKRSSLLDEDIKLAESEEQRDKTNCLITEVVVPGFDWEDHKYMDEAELKHMFAGQGGGEETIEEFSRFLYKA